MADAEPYTDMGRRVIGLGSPVTPTECAPSHSGINGAEGTPQPPPEPARAPRSKGTKRGSYVSRACLNCQKRKVKCSGEQTCEQCVLVQLECAYSDGRKRRKTTNAPAAPPADARSETSAATSGGHGPPQLPDFVQQAMARIATLERDRDSLRDRLIAQGGGHPSNQYASPQSCVSGPKLPDKTTFHGATSILESIEAVGRTLAHESESQQHSRAQTPLPSGYEHIAWRSLPRGSGTDIDALERETRAGDTSALRHSLDVFFRLLNPHYPCFNENQVRSHVEKFLANDASSSLSDADRHQVVALINLIQAEVKILSEDWPNSSTAPAWEEFCHAESIIDRLTWLGNGNLLTVQCLILKARCLFYLENGEAACETMAKVVRLCFHLGLHDQSSWGDTNPFDVVMRQRVIWTVYYLERHLTFNVGVPYLLRDSDMNVGLPGNYDDTLMFPDLALPEQLPENAVERSFSTYLSLAVRWGKLSAEIWDSVFAVTAQKPTSEEFVASMDARIGYLTSQFPPFLQWERVAQAAIGDPSLPPYVRRQATILRLRNNQLRLLLRQEDILSMKNDARTAEDYAAIAADSIGMIQKQSGPEMHKSVRWSAVFYLMATLLPLVSIILRSDNAQTTRAAAIEAYTKGQSMLDKLAPEFGSARHALRRIHRIVFAAKRAIRKFREGETSPLSQNAMQLETADPLVDFDFYAADALLDPEKDEFNEMLTGMMSDPAFGSTGDQDSAFWTGNGLFDSQWSI